MSDLTQSTANATKVFGLCAKITRADQPDCTNSAVGQHGFCAAHKPLPFLPDVLKRAIAKDENREHILGCDEMHGHMAPTCCSQTCWCLPLRNFNKDSNTALARWEKTCKKLTEDQRAYIDSFIHTLEVCLKFGNGQIWLGLEAKSALAWEFYKVDNTEEPPKPKGRREAIEHTRRQNEAEDE